MPKPRTSAGEKNLISQRLIELRRQHNMSQRLLAYQLQLNGYDMDKNVITRIETNKRYVTDIELNRNFLSLGITLLFHIHKGIIGCRQALDFLAFRYFLWYNTY